jgi:hypothetical protein
LTITTYILDGHEPVPEPDLIAWARWMAAHADRHVARDEPSPGITVSTVFLGIDLNYRPPPLVFETMVFCDYTGDEPTWRYATWDEAVAGHARAIAMLQCEKITMPGFWMHETSGVLRPVILAYLNGEAMTGEQIVVMRTYLRGWIEGPWQGKNIDLLRATVGSLTSRAEIASWLEVADREGIDPL